MAKDGFKVIDSDMHVMEPADLWQTYISPEFRDLAPVGAEEYFMDLRLKHDGRVIARNQDNFADEGAMYVESSQALRQASMNSSPSRTGAGAPIPRSRP